jgi:hypothetical protein
VDLGQPGAGRRAVRRLVAGAIALLVAAGCTAAGPDRPSPGPGPAPGPAPAATAVNTPPPGAGTPRYLKGRPLTEPTGLRLLVASDPPRLVDVDRGTSRPVDGLPTGEVPFSVAAVGEDAIVAADRQVFVLERWSPRARQVGAGDAVASLDGRGIWLLERGRRCTLREIGLDSLARRPPRRVPCTIGLVADTPLGLLVWTEPSAAGEQGALLELGSGRVVARYPEVHGVVGSQILWSSSPTCPGAGSRARSPTSGCSTSRPAAGGGCPACPLITAVKFMSMAWTDDGRLVLAGDFERFGKALAVWRPGQDHLAVKRLPLPDPAGSDSFVPWPAPA